MGTSVQSYPCKTLVTASLISLLSSCCELEHSPIAACEAALFSCKAETAAAVTLVAVEALMETADVRGIEFVDNISKR